jgi:hypothetical protein
MERVDEVVGAYCARAGTGAPAPREDGSYVLKFDGKYEIQFSPAGNDQLLLRADLPGLKDGRSRQDDLRRLLRINLALSGRKHSTLSLDRAQSMPFLYDVLEVTAAEVATSPRLVTRFINEVAAFHKALERVH